MHKRISILDCPVDVLTMEQTLAIINTSIQTKTPVHHVVINAAKLVNAQKDQELKASILDCDIINADGQAIVWASRILNKPLPERVAGIDLMVNLIDLAHAQGYRIFFLGAKEEVVRKVLEICKLKYGEGIIAGYRNGYFKKSEEPSVAYQISESKADILFVAISSPRKEIFLNTYKDILQVPFIMGVGGSFDVVSGLTKRAPKWMQDTGLEWLFRVMQEPRRMWKRYLVTNTIFIYLLAKEVLKHKVRPRVTRKKLV